MFIAYAILKLSRSKMKLCIFKNFADKNDSPPSVPTPSPPPPITIGSSKLWYVSQQVLFTFHTTRNRIFSKIRERM